MNIMTSFSKQLITKHGLIHLVYISIFIVISLLFIHFTVDDSFISYRYGKNLIEYGIWNFNLDPNDKVEGYTNFIYAALSIIPHLLRIDPINFFKFISLLILFRFVWLIKIYSEDKLTYYLCLLFVFVNPVFIVHLFSGLETPLFALFLLEALLSVIYYQSSSTPKLYTLFLLLPLTRPEGLIFSTVLFFLYITKKKSLPNFQYLIATISVGIIYFIWRFTYFGYLFPNTYYAKKVDNVTIGEITRMLIYDDLAYYIFFSLILMIWLTLSTKEEKNNKLFKQDLWIILAINTLISVGSYATSNMDMNYAGRFGFQLFFPLIICILLLVKKTYKTLIIPLLILIMINFFARYDFIQLMTYYPRLEISHKSIGVAFKKYQDKNYKMVVGDAGIISYESDWNIIDSHGLADVEVAHEGLTVDLLNRKKPEIIVIYSANLTEDGAWSGIETQDNIRKYVKGKDNYEFVPGTSFNKTYFMNFYIDKNIEIYQELKKIIQELSAKSIEKNQRSTKDILFDYYFGNKNI